MLSCFPIVADPSTVVQWRVPFPLAKRVAELVSPLSFTRQSRSNFLNAYFPDLCLEGQNLSSHFAFSRACSVIFLFTILQATRWVWETLYYAIRLFFLEGSSTFCCVSEVFQRFRKVNIKLKPSKCHFSCHQVNYLGHVISSTGVQPDPQKVTVVN